MLSYLLAMLFLVFLFGISFLFIIGGCIVFLSLSDPGLIFSTHYLSENTVFSINLLLFLASLFLFYLANKMFKYSVDYYRVLGIC